MMLVSDDSHALPPQHTPIAENRILYRGLSGVMLGKNTLERRQFVELGFSSATPQKAVALGYAGHTDGLPTLFEIEVGQIDNGASLREFSHVDSGADAPVPRPAACARRFPAEEEVCLPPLSNFELVGEGRVEDGLCIFRVKLNVNLKAKTLDELKQERKVAAQ
eukprot:3804443-Rhodomonas_salina.2